MKKLFVGLMSMVLLTGIAVAGAGLSSQDEAAIKAAGLSVYPGAVVLPGPGAMGFRFATSDNVNKVRSWYQEKTSGWAVFDDGSMWILYNGKPGLNPIEVMAKSQVLINSSEDLPLVHGLDKNMTTEIVLIPVSQ